MGESFRGWKRRLGLVTLVFACLFAGLWISSQQVERTLTYITDGDDTAELAWTAERTGLTWSKRTGSGQYVHSDFFGLNWWSYDYQADDETPLKTEVTWGFWGFEIGDDGIWHPETQPGKLMLIKSRFAFWTIPHWSVVVPLTALSAWLLLSPRRKPTLKP